MTGSPYLTSGTGINDPGGGSSEFDADQEVITNPDGDLLYAVNGHSNSIAAFTINGDGTLTTVPGSPFASGGQDPASVGLLSSAGLLVVANKNEDPNQDIGADLPNYTTFKVNCGRKLDYESWFNLGSGCGLLPFAGFDAKQRPCLFWDGIQNPQDCLL